MPAISVIVPVYNVELYLEKCVDSILDQTFRDFDLILVDDGSTDRSGLICDSYVDKCSDKGITCKVIHQQNGGLSAARNTGIDWAMLNSKSEWLSFIDSDDYIKKDFLEKLYNPCIGNRSDICICDFIPVDEHGICLDEPHEFPSGVYDSPEDFFRILYNNWRTVVAWNKLYRKSLFHHVRYDVGKIHEDEFIIHRLFGKSKRITYISDQLYMYLSRKGSIVQSETNVTKQLYALEAWTRRYWYCKKHGFPVNRNILTGDYMLSVIALKRAVPKNQRQYYMKIRGQYKKMYIDSAKNAMKARLTFDFYLFRKGLRINKK